MISKTTLVALLATSVSASVNDLFADHLYGKTEITEANLIDMYDMFLAEHKTDSPIYKSLANKERFEVFKQTVQDVVQHNSQNDRTWDMGINEFSDITNEEFMSFYTFQGQDDCSATDPTSALKALEAAVPDSWNWREHDGVSPVKNQGHCGSCWTFSTVGTLEARTLIKYGKDNLRTYSEQQLVDCAGDYGNHGCNGGLPSRAFEYINQVGGLASEDSYPYTAVDGTCYYDAATQKSVEVLTGAVDIARGDEDELKNAVYHVGPVSIAFEVIDGFKNYKSGVYSVDNCGTKPSDVNHAVVAVGYGVEDKKDYWLIKNSWGAAWGDEGFFKMARNVNMCGVAQCNSYPSDIWITNHAPTEETI